jgi:2-keto-4-pentenoate hydratase/2-oxohepta-3-ene-1,7-dioic acid hydratase in catechol pathway
MKLCRYNYQGKIGCGRLEGSLIHTYGGDLTGALTPAGPVLRLGEVQLLPPVLPGKIIGIGKNYAAHAREMGGAPPDEDPLIFLKAPSAVIGPDEVIVLPAVSQRVDHEAELGVVIGRRARDLRPEEDPLHYVLGYVCVNDVTARDLQSKDVQFTRAKSFDTFCPLGPWVVPVAPSPEARLSALLDGAEVQHGFVGDMLVGPLELLAFASGIMTLEPGDVLMTGTPPGVGPLAAGQTVTIVVEGVGELRNTVA